MTEKEEMQDFAFDVLEANGIEWYHIPNRVFQNRKLKDRTDLEVLVYDHHSRELSRKLIGIQHKSVVNILATTHIHLDLRHCAEMTMVRGRPSAIRELCDALGREKGVLHAALSGTSTGDRLV